MSMSHTNGTTPRTEPTTLTERRAELECKLLERQLSLMESLWQDDQSFGGSDILERIIRQASGGGNDSDGGLWVPINVPSDRRGGTDWPFWRTETQLASLRQKSRVICKANSYAKGMLGNLTSHIVGKGYTYKAALVDEVKGDGVLPNGAAYSQLIRAVQHVIDDFCKRNRWNCSADPREGRQVGSTREREACRRVFRDGEAYLRFFFLTEGEDAGKTYVRFVEPSCVRQPPGGSESDGWQLGIRHRVEPYEDLEDVLSYWITYSDVALVNDETKRDPLGEEVPAQQLVHIKDPDEDALVSRGTPWFAWDTFDAFHRAARLQRAISIGSAIRACTAEIWQHATASQSQITSLAAGVGVARSNPQTGQTEYTERMRPGMIRRIPAGQTTVNPPTGGVQENLEAAQGDLRQAASAFSAPEYMASADASNANFASTKEAGTPFVRTAECLQEHFKACYLTCVWKAVRWAVESGLLPPETLQLIEIQAEAPKVSQRDSLQVAQEDAILIPLGVKDRQTAAMERGLDPDLVSANNAEWQQQNGQAGMGLGLDDGTGGPPPPTPRMPTGVRESRDASGHEHAADGKFGKGSGSPNKDKPGSKRQEVQRDKKISGRALRRGEAAIETAHALAGELPAYDFMAGHQYEGDFKRLAAHIRNMYQTHHEGSNDAKAARTRRVEAEIVHMTASKLAAKLASNDDRTMSADDRTELQGAVHTLRKIAVAAKVAATHFEASRKIRAKYKRPAEMYESLDLDMPADADTIRLLELAEWDEGKHKRGDGGRFGSGGGGGKQTDSKPPASGTGGEHLSKLGEAADKLASDIGGNPEAADKAQSVYSKVGHALAGLALGEFPSWALDTADLWMFEHTMGQAGSAAGVPGAVLLTKAVAFGAAKAWIAVRSKITGGVRESAEQTPDLHEIAAKLHEVMRAIAEHTGFGVPSDADLIAELEKASKVQTKESRQRQQTRERFVYDDNGLVVERITEVVG